LNLSKNWSEEATFEPPFTSTPNFDNVASKAESVGISKAYLFYGGIVETGKLDVSAVKIVNVHPENPSKYGLPTVMER